MNDQTVMSNYKVTRILRRAFLPRIMSMSDYTITNIWKYCGKIVSYIYISTDYLNL